MGTIPEMRLEVYALKRQEKGFASLAGVVKDTFLKHADPQVRPVGGFLLGRMSVWRGRTCGEGRVSSCYLQKPEALPLVSSAYVGTDMRTPGAWLKGCPRCAPPHAPREQVAQQCVAALAACARTGPDTIKAAAQLALTECTDDVAAGLASAVGALERAGARRVAAAVAAYETSGGEEEAQVRLACLCAWPADHAVLREHKSVGSGRLRAAFLLCKPDAGASSPAWRQLARPLLACFPCISGFRCSLMFGLPWLGCAPCWR